MVRKKNNPDHAQAVARLLRAEFMRYWNRQYNETGIAPDQLDFANWLGVSPPSLSRWMRGNGLPNDLQKQQIARRLGVAIYEATGGPPMLPDVPEVQEIVADWFELTPGEQEQVLRLVRAFGASERRAQENVPGSAGA